MKAWLPAVAVASLLALAAVLAFQPGAAPTADERADEVARELRCPDCQGLSVADSPTSAAQEIRRQIAELVAAGATAAEIRAHFVARYGEWILLAPSSPAYWLIPFVVVGAGAATLGMWLRGATRPARSSRVAPSADERQRLRDEVEALDA